MPRIANHQRRIRLMPAPLRKNMYDERMTTSLCDIHGLKIVHIHYRHRQTKQALQCGAQKRQHRLIFLCRTAVCRCWVTFCKKTDVYQYLGICRLDAAAKEVDIKLWVQAT